MFQISLIRLIDNTHIIICNFVYHFCTTFLRSFLLFRIYWSNLCIIGAGCVQLDF